MKKIMGILVLVLTLSFLTGSALAIEEKIAATGITVVSPNGGEIWPKGTIKEIKWAWTGNPGSNVNIELWKGGMFYKVIASSTSNDGSYMWSIPSNYIIGTNYKIRIRSTTMMMYSDMSNNYFTIAGINVIMPNGGEIWPRGTTKEIKWASIGSAGPNVKIELWKGGMLYKVIASGTPNDGSYMWPISYTTVLGSDYKIKIVSTTNPVYMDMSNNYYTIAGINVNSPNGGEIWSRETSHTINWNYRGNPGPNVIIELWKGGMLHHVISSSTPNDGSYSWMIHHDQQIGNDYKVKIKSSSNPIYWDMSNNYFRIN